MYRPQDPVVAPAIGTPAWQIALQEAALADKRAQRESPQGRMGVSVPANTPKATPGMAPPPRPAMGPSSYDGRTQSVGVPRQVNGETAQVVSQPMAPPDFELPGTVLSSNLRELKPDMTPSFRVPPLKDKRP